MQLVQQGKKKQEHVSHRGPYKAVREQRVKGSPWVSAVTCTQHSHNWGSFNLPLGIHQQWRKAVQAWERNILPSAELMFLLIEFPE